VRKDRLKEINDELRLQSENPSSPWLPLESNPELFTEFAHSIGVPQEWSWCDVLGFDESLLDMLPKPCAAVILLFPCTENMYEARAREEEIARTQGRADMPNAFFLKQHAEFGNACGTIASVHALSNSRWAFKDASNRSAHSSNGGNPNTSLVAALDSFCEAQCSASADERGRALLMANNLKHASDGAALAATAQTTCPDRDGPDLDHHFTAFVYFEGRLLELDGTKFGPVDHGPCDESGVLEAASAAIRKCFMSLEPGSIEFSLLALCRHGQ